jgi:hypothetical protein
MNDVLGYERFAPYGRDIGGMVTYRLGLEFADCLVGFMTSYVGEPYPRCTIVFFAREQEKSR